MSPPPGSPSLAGSLLAELFPAYPAGALTWHRPLSDCHLLLLEEASAACTPWLCLTWDLGELPKWAPPSLWGSSKDQVRSHPYEVLIHWKAICTPWGCCFPSVPLLPNGTPYPRGKDGGPQHGQTSGSRGTFVAEEVVRTVESRGSVCACVSFIAATKSRSPATPA